MRGESVYGKYFCVGSLPFRWLIITAAAKTTNDAQYLQGAYADNDDAMASFSGVLNILV